MKTLNTIFISLAIILGTLGLFFLEGIEARISNIAGLFFILFRLFSYVLYEFCAGENFEYMNANRQVEQQKIRS